MPGNQQERRWRIILEPHPAGPLQPSVAAADRAIGGNLLKPRLQRADGIQIGLDPGDIRLVLRRERHRLRAGKDREQDGSGKQGATFHGP